MRKVLQSSFKRLETVPFVAACMGSQDICYELASKGSGTEIKDDIQQQPTSFITEQEKLMLCPQSNCSTVNLDMCVMNSTTYVEFFIYLKQYQAPYNLSRRTTKMNTTLDLAICELKTNAFFTGIS